MNKEGKLIHVKLGRIEELSKIERKKLGKKETGLFVEEVRINRASSIKEVKKLVKLYNVNKEKAYDYYEEEHKLTFNRAKEILQWKQK